VARADLLRAIHSWATRRGLMLVLSGIDLNPRSAIEAVAATPTGTVVSWETGDVFDQALEPKPDCSRQLSARPRFSCFPSWRA
jgi:hypothetical protein